MKKVIVIVAIVVVALVGLTSYNGTTVKKNNGNGNLIAELKGNGGGSASSGTSLGTDKKRD